MCTNKRCAKYAELMDYMCIVEREIWRIIQPNLGQFSKLSIIIFFLNQKPSVVDTIKSLSTSKNQIGNDFY